MIRPLALLPVLFLAFASGSSATETPDATSSDATPPSRPNVVVMLVDDLGWNDVGYHGSEIATPNIDRLAAGGVRLERFYALQECTPSRAALLTGRHPIRYGFQRGVLWHWTRVGLPLEERTLAETMRDAGYATAMVGKWHLGMHEPAYLPEARGFDYFYGVYGGLVDYYEHRYYQGLDWHRNGEAVEEEGYATTLLGRDAARVVREHDYAGEPLFLYFAPTAPHAPLQSPESYTAPYAGIADENRRTFAGMTAALDEAVGWILEALEARGQRDRTLVLFASDNGGGPPVGGDNRPLRGQKSELWEGGVRVVAAASWPGVLPEGAVVETPIHLVDVHPTVARLAGVSAEPRLPLDGIDVWPALARGEALPREELLINIQARQSALIRGRYKIVRTSGVAGAEVELFDLVDDPEERRDLADRMPAKLLELEDRLLHWTGQAKRPVGPHAHRLPTAYPVPRVWGDPSSPPAPLGGRR